MSNEPAGASQDSRNPTHEDKELCRYCDEDLINEIVIHQVVAEYGEDWNNKLLPEQKYSHLFSKYGLCKECFREQEADMRDDL